MEGKIPLHVSNGTAYVWSVDDIETLRVTHRICGTLSGTLPSVSQQNVFLGTPLTLLPEEVAALVNTGIACIVHDARSHGVPTKHQLQRWAQVRRSIIDAEIKEREASVAPVKVDTSDKAQKKRLEREARKAAQAQQSELSSVTVAEPEPPTSAIVTQQQQHTVHVPGPSAELPWYTAQIFHTIDEAREVGVWAYPRDLKERAECAVFRDLWEKGNYLGPGIKFGGNYLVYPGDPLRFHSHFVASVHPSGTSAIRPMDIVAFGRLGTATKKVHLLCGYDDESGAVSYHSIEWASFG
ncbi:tRNA-splicing endonuclease subunit Sen34 OS=Homo sapiens GN=TSEN34 PE=1 SV=1 [Rhizoctonia solani AG-1 IB]|uniref:tRNA-splicing endonuclease subunit Sen34 n=1 Tax=Thanatephorus cucumeris (strain AG1-IB / isolate 7/3/14) TaxID=1108050 RepID=A0A0B7F2J9_THACB|nr:tRNA-splicing endonuclease subunit Sen34 OS=Homo sapiens GN=TSEN34 PE=1 SV=1 [Rhizoctonia solani AG-1 IB]